MALAVLPVFCGCDQDSIDPPADTSVSDGLDGTDALDVEAVDGCTREMTDVESLGQAALYHDDGFWIVEVVVGGNLAFPPVDLVQLELWPERDGPAEPGEYEVDGEAAYAQCGLCVLLRETCIPEDGLARCGRDFVATAGSVEIVDLEEPGGTISGVIRDVELVETSIDWDSGSFESETVPGGQVVCIDRVEFESVVSTYPAR